MADLDDFFAKKDKKKTKTKKFLTAEEIAKKLEDTSKKGAEPQKPKKERPSTATSGYGTEGDDLNQTDENQEDEWKEFEQEERKDYTGLKICQLTIAEDNQNQSNAGQDGELIMDGQSDGEGVQRNAAGKIQFGPWKKVAASTSEETPQAANEPEKPTTTNKVYITPALRNQPLKSVKNRHRDAPDIKNEEYFPTLGAARPEEQRKKKNEPAFEEVRHGSRVTRLQEMQQSAPIAVGNRFKSLADDDS